MTILQDKTVTTRKRHHCAWCDEFIEIGETVPYRSYIWDESVASEWMHPECREAMRRVHYDQLEEGFYPGEHARGGTEYRG